MALRQCVGSILRQFRSPTSFACIHAGCTLSTSATNDLVLLSIDDKTGVATMKMNKKPVNSLNVEMFTALNIAIEKAENEKCRGLILTSANPKIFSAGLDIQELYQPEVGRLKELWRGFQDFWINLYLSRFPTVAAINGGAPAAGCHLAMSCDYRIMASGNYKMGLNETLLGIPAPFWLIDTMMNTIGFRETEKALQLGLLYTPEEALKVGLIDEVVDEDQVLQRAQSELVRWMQIPEYARHLTKTIVRKPTVDRLLARKDEDIENFADFIPRDGVQKAIGFYLESLKKRTKK